MVADHQGGEHQGGVTPQTNRGGDDESDLRRSLRRCACCWSAMRCAQTSYPEQTVRILVGFPAGTAPDVAARIVADKFALNWGKPVVVENITGASGNIAVDRVAKAPPRRLHAADGRQLVADHERQPVRQAAVRSGEGLRRRSARSSSPRTCWWCIPTCRRRASRSWSRSRKAKPGELTYGHTGPGTSQHLAGELFKYMAKVSIQPVAYRGSTAVLPDLLAGRLTMSFSNVVNAAPLVREGKLRAFAVTLAQALGRGARPADHGRDAAIRVSRRCRGSACWRRPERRRRSSTRCTRRP